MSHDSLKYLSDALQAGRYIKDFTENIEFEEYQSNILVKSAVERQFEIIGEALKNLRNYSPELFTEIPEGGRIIDFRNLISHGYAVVSDKLVWQAARDKLPSLMKELQLLSDKSE
ncbi:MAG: DUF86 domain-containing protein [Candidatus Riflebacteria bacterium]|nr:DUF86 domain-containing protein [Candidatus Riflebacteria bacterium]